MQAGYINNHKREPSHSSAPELLSRGLRSRMRFPRWGKALFRQEGTQTLRIDDEKIQGMYALYASKGAAVARINWRTQRVLSLWLFRTLVIEKAKRGLDLFICFILLPFALPIMLLTLVMVKIDSPGPVLFRQERVGKWGRKFYCLKFRSMHTDAEARKAALMKKNEAGEIVFKMKNDPRVTRVGRLIRKLSIDELPQIFNVLQGEMSIVGPRPPVPIEVSQYTLDHLQRLEVIPGITGLQQVSGRSNLPFHRWIELDVQYIEEQSVVKDLEIIIKTIPAVISGKGAY
jgi:lipopolysaccharide/colanic/teichoic acid biosynthesis glycosyltransferase